MPDNAEDLWIATGELNPNLAGVSFSVCAIGDTSYDEFCKAGTDWDEKLVSLGATRVHDIQLCDVEYEPEWEKWANAVIPLLAAVDGGAVSESAEVAQTVATPAPAPAAEPVCSPEGKPKASCSRTSLDSIRPNGLCSGTPAWFIGPPAGGATLHRWSRGAIVCRAHSHPSDNS